jgi:phosphatidate cytidylyltransferase
LPAGEPSSSEQAGRQIRVGSDLPLRVVSALALAPLAIGAAYLGGSWFLLFWLIAGIGILWEWAGLVAGKGARLVTVIGVVALVAAASALISGNPASALLAVIAGAGIAAVWAPINRAWSGSGVAYAAAAIFPAVLLRSDQTYGFAALMLLFAVVWGTDIAAYFGGRLIGGPKLMPRASPKKTWSGAIVGAVAALAGGVSVASFAALPNVVAIGFLCLVLSIASQAGDLLESALKRRFNAKDSSGLIPGHGGLMDRLDGFVTAALVAALIGLARGGLATPSTGLLIW